MIQIFLDTFKELSLVLLLVLVVSLILIYLHNHKPYKTENWQKRYEAPQLPNVAFYRNEIPSIPNAPQLPNVAFYRNEIPSIPNGDYIEKILTYWKGDYQLLEINHSYIQWLFPNKYPGLNADAYPLKREEAKIIRETRLLQQRVKRAFEMMLDFYGMKLTEDNRFELADNCVERLGVLNQRGNPNFLRISRILWALKDLGHSNLMVPWMILLADLIYAEKLLYNARESFENYWLDTLHAEDRKLIERYINQEQ